MSLFIDHQVPPLPAESLGSLGTMSAAGGFSLCVVQLLVDWEEPSSTDNNNYVLFLLALNIN